MAIQDADADIADFDGVDSEEAEEELVGPGASRGKEKGRTDASDAGGKKAAASTGPLSKEERRREREERRKQQAELELLLMDDSALRDAARGVGSKAFREASALGPDADGSGKGGKLNKKEKRELKKQQRRAAREGSDEEDVRNVGKVSSGKKGGDGDGGEDGEEGAGFAVNLEDPRFGEMFSSHLFALDPTDPR